MSCERYSLAAGVVAWLSRSVRLCTWIAPRADLISKGELGSKGKRSDALFVHGEIEPAKFQGRSGHEPFDGDHRKDKRRSACLVDPSRWPVKVM